MITLSKFQEYLTLKPTLPQASRQHLNEQEQQLLKWSASLPTQTEAEQVNQLEKVLTELMVTDLDDKLRLQLMSVVVSTMERLVTSLHKYYIHESGALNVQQLQYTNQIKSLYYLCILVYDGVVQRECMALEFQQRDPVVTGWRRFLTPAKTPPLLLAGAIYSSLIIYQKLQYENSLSYQKPPQYMWSSINELYLLSYQHATVHIDLSTQVVTRQATSIHQLYNQMGLHNLLNVRTMIRPNIMLLQRLLPVWTKQLTATIEPQTYTRVFVDINSDDPPSYLTADSSINPYDEQYTCLFIEMEPLAAYLEQRKQALDDNGNEAIEYWLVAQVLMIIKHRYLERQLNVPTKYSPKQRATIITGFDSIHYHVAEQRSLMDIVDAKSLPSDQRPRYDTQPKKNAPSTTIEVETFDSTDVVSKFRMLHLLRVQDIEAAAISLEGELLNVESMPVEEHEGNMSSIMSVLTTQTPNRISDNNQKRIIASTAPPPLRVVSLFLLCRPNITNKLKWSLGMVRWLNLDSDHTEVEWQVLGHILSPCALRLDNPDTLDPRFAPAFIIADDDNLQTGHSLLVPPYHFHSQDRVIIRINDEQKSLRLQRRLLHTKEFSQYEFIML